MFVHPNQVRFAVGQVAGVKAVQVIITRPDGVRDHLGLLVDTAEGVDRQALTDQLAQAVQGICRVRVDEVIFVPAGGLSADAPLVRDAREWE
jgi:hypothetical protein